MKQLTANDIPIQIPENIAWLAQEAKADLTGDAPTDPDFPGFKTATELIWEWIDEHVPDTMYYNNWSGYVQEEEEHECTAFDPVPVMFGKELANYI